MIRARTRHAGLMLLTCALLSCRASGEPEPAAMPAAIVEPGDSVFSPSEERVSLPRERIYYTLTSFDWYARGEPLVHADRTYRPSGMPIAASVDEMSRLGEFHGVEFYAREGSTAAEIYVPVFEGYWQVFRTDAEVIDTTASAVPPADPDSVSLR